MRPTRHVTAMLLLAAFGASGCSKGGETSDAKRPSPSAAQAKPVVAIPAASVSATPAASSATHTDEKEAVPRATSMIAGPVSFADGETAYHDGKYADATAIFEHYTVQRPANAWGHYMLGLSAWKSGDLTKSEMAFEKALSIDPSHVKSVVNLSRVLIAQKRHDEAIDRLTHAAEIAPESADVHRLLGRAYHDRRQTDDAVTAYRRAIELNERDAWSMNNLGLLLLEAQRADEALPLLVRAVELRKDVREFHNNLGMALEHTGRFRAAAMAYSGALTVDPGYEKAKQNLARVEAVRSGPEEPFEVPQAPNASVDVVAIPNDKTARN